MNFYFHMVQFMLYFSIKDQRMKSLRVGTFAANCIGVPLVPFDNGQDLSNRTWELQKDL